jgi:HSP20 family protein
MTTMTRFVPLRSTFNEMAALQDRFNSIFSEFARPLTTDTQTETASAMGSFVPAVDVYEDANALKLQLEVPGVKQDDLDIRIENQTLTIKGERKLESAAKQENFHRIERRFGSFTRTFTLPQTIDTEAVTASYDAGVLTVSLGKKAEAQPKQVKIEVLAPGQNANLAANAKPVEGERIS